MTLREFRLVALQDYDVVYSSCLDALQKLEFRARDGQYWINHAGTSDNQLVYCDMEHGGYELVFKSTHSSPTVPAALLLAMWRGSLLIPIWFLFSYSRWAGVAKVVLCLRKCCKSGYRKPRITRSEPLSQFFANLYGPILFNCCTSDGSALWTTSAYDFPTVIPRNVDLHDETNTYGNGSLPQFQLIVLRNCR